jgi:hypothetical protein
MLVEIDSDEIVRARVFLDEAAALAAAETPSRAVTKRRPRPGRSG